MALMKCPECNGEVSENASVCPHCGNPVKDSFESELSFADQMDKKNVAAFIVGVLLELFACIIFFSFSTEYIDKEVLFGSDYNSYTYQVYVYIATALRFGLSGILVGLGALLQIRCSGVKTFVGSIITKRKK